MSEAGPTLALLFLTASLTLPRPAGAETQASFPQPRDEAGRFLNLAGPLDRAGLDVTLPFFLRRIGKLLTGRKGLPERVANDGSFLRENAKASLPTITWIGHATLLVQMEHQAFLTDPIWSERASPVSFAGPRRFQPPGLALDDLPPIDFVVISHNHYDHLDLPTLVEIARRHPAARFLVPLENGKLLRDAGLAHVEELGWGQTAQVGGLEVHCLPSQHWSRRGLFDEREALWASWAVVAPRQRLYFAGDTGYFAGFTEIGRRLGPFDVAAVPIGAYRPREMMRAFHMDPAEAVQAGRDLTAHHLIGIHYGTFDLSDEPPAEPPERFRVAGRVAGYAPEAIWLPAVGETIVVPETDETRPSR